MRLLGVLVCGVNAFARGSSAPSSIAITLTTETALLACELRAEVRATSAPKRLAVSCFGDFHLSRLTQRQVHNLRLKKGGFLGLAGRLRLPHRPGSQPGYGSADDVRDRFYQNVQCQNTKTGSDPGQTPDSATVVG